MPTALAPQLETLLKQHTEMVRARGNPLPTDCWCVQEFVLKHGFPFAPMTCPKRYLKGVAERQCFMNALRIAKKYNLIYVEGFALSIIPLPHAWCVAPGSNKVIDPTWDEAKHKYDIGREYYGVPIRLDYVMESYKKSRQYSVLDDWENEWPIISDPESLWKHDYRPPDELANGVSRPAAQVGVHPHQKARRGRAPGHKRP